MSLGVLNNIAAIYAQNNLNQTQNSLQNVLTQLSSGSRINSGADDAAGLAVANGLQANVAALTQSSQNATAGVGLLQTADGALAQVTNLLNRAVTLATEAANGTLNTNQVSSANQEYQNIISEVGNIGSTTNFNGNTVFSSTATKLFVSDGTTSGANVFNDTVGALTTSSVGESAPGAATSVSFSTPVVPTTTVPASSSLTLSGASDALSGTLSITYAGGSPVSLTIAAGSTLSSVATQINGAGIAGVTAAVGTGVNANKLTITGSVGAANTLALTGTSLTDTPTATGAGVDFSAPGIASLTAGSAQTVLTSVTSAIADVAYQRGTLGANINQLNAASNVANSEQVNLTSAASNITSTNYGQATSDMAKFKVLSETGISALSQANSVQQEVLKLLQ